MNIRRFVASDMREALAAIRADLGVDAVMLSTRKLPEGVEVIAAIDYDDSLLAAAEAPTRATAGDDQGGRSRQRDEDRRVREDDRDRLEHEHEHENDRWLRDSADERQSRAKDDRPAASSRNNAVGRSIDYLVGDDHDDDERDERDDERFAEADRLERAVRRTLDNPVDGSNGDASPSAAVVDEIKDLRRLLETQLASLAWNDLNREAPVRARLLREMARFGVDAGLAMQLAAEIPSDLSAQEALRALVRRFGDRLPLAQWDMADRGGIFAIVGPTGVGKTTTIAKIAARFVLRHGLEGLALVSTDTYRVGARQQLSSFARILRAPLHIAQGPEELRRVLDGLYDKKLVLIDTAGMSQRDVRLANQFATLRVEGHRVQTVLALSAGADRGCLAQALAAFQPATPEALIVTKLDEASALGGVLSIAIRAGLPIAYLADGQRVPEDLHLATPKRFWLMHNVVKLTQTTAADPDENELAVSFGGREIATHA
jgi:flagellar biosynthesis protein FlhF